MAWQVVWTGPAWRDLEGTADYIAHDSPTYAKAFAGRIWAASQSLTELPRRGRIVPELDDEAVRELLVDSFRLIYELHLDPELVYILGVIHGSRDLLALWEREERGET